MARLTASNRVGVQAGQEVGTDWTLIRAPVSYPHGHKLHTPRRQHARFSICCAVYINPFNACSHVINCTVQQYVHS